MGVCACRARYLMMSECARCLVGWTRTFRKTEEMRVQVTAYIDVGSDLSADERCEVGLVRGV